MSSPYQKAYFLLSIADVKQLPPDIGIEVAIVGRSNAGKSSVLNTITQNKQLARVSKTPGRTQLLNIFVIEDGKRFVDLPGYGFAKAKMSAKLQWQRAIDEYLKNRKCLKGLILIMDIRHPLKPLDLQLLDYCQRIQLPVHIVLNKADKLSKNDVAQTIKAVRSALTPYVNSVTLQGFSASKGTGLKELHTLLNQWFQF